MSTTNPGSGDRTDRVLDLGSFGDDTGSVSQVVRVFGSESDAEGYPATLEATIGDCPRYAVSFDENRWDADVVATVLDLSGVDAVGGVRSTSAPRYRRITAPAEPPEVTEVSALPPEPASGGL